MQHSSKKSYLNNKNNVSCTMSFIFGVLQYFLVLDPLQLNLSTQPLSVVTTIDSPLYPTL